MPFRPFSRAVVYDLPPALDDWVAADHPVRFIAAFVDALTDADWQAMDISRVPPRLGTPAYDPVLLTCAWLGGFVLGIRSSRKLARACHDLVPLRWLTANQQPDHNTLWRFYAAHRAGMRHLLRVSVQTAIAAELVELAVLAIDGTKVSGNAARERTYDAAGLERLLGRLDAAIADLEAQNEAGPDDEPPALPPALRRASALRTRVATALAQVQAPDGPTRLNLTDADAVLLSTRQGWVAGYNAQAAVTPTVPTADGTGGLLITAAAVTTDVVDQAQLLPMLDASAATTARDPDVVLADGGYHAGAVLAACAARGQLVVIPDHHTPDATTPYHKDYFTYTADQDAYVCPHGQVLTARGRKQRAGREVMQVYRAAPALCRACPAFGVCTTDARHGRAIEVSPHEGVLRAHRDWMGTEAAQALRRCRQTLVEPVFGILKEELGLRRWLLRGQAAVAAEWSLLATASNLRTLVRYWRDGRLAALGCPMAA
jgi:transposase